MRYILGIKFRDYGQIYFFTLPENQARKAKNTAHAASSSTGIIVAPVCEPPAATDASPVTESLDAAPDAAGGSKTPCDHVPFDHMPEGQEGGTASLPSSRSLTVLPLAEPEARPQPEGCGGGCPCAASSLEFQTIEGQIIGGQTVEEQTPAGESGAAPAAPGSCECARDADGCSVRVGDVVIAETGQGLGFGVVVHVSTRVPAGIEEAELRPIARVTTEADAAALAENHELTKASFAYCTSRVRSRNLEMKLVDVEILYDKSKFIFYFTAPTRIDFRELVKDLVREYHVRIELRQIGVRHETQMIGAVGNCGMVCCCRRFLRKFAPVTIKMAKEQNLFLNPAKISGICGRLLCCLSYEQENYDAFHRECPRLGKRYQTSRGEFKVLRANMFRNCIIVLNAVGEEEEISLEEWQALEPRRPEPQPGLQKAEQRPQRPQGDGFMIVSADPDTLEELETLPHEEAPAALPDAGAGGQKAADIAADGEKHPARPRRKRKRRPQ